MILISAAGSGGTNGILNSFDGEIIGITNNRFKLFSSKIKAFLVPNAIDEENYINRVNEIIKKNKITLFIPNSDIEVYIVSKNLEKIKTKTFLPSFKMIDLSFDKLKLHKRLEKLKINTPKTYHMKSIKDLKKPFSELKKPLWCRIREGAGSQHTSKVISKKDAKFFIKHSCNVYNLKVEDFIINQYLEGDDIAVMTLWKVGKLKMCKMMKRVSYQSYAGESAPNVLVSFYDKKIEKFIKKAILSLDCNANGILNIDIKCDRASNPYITEINAGRFMYNMQLFNSGTNAFNLFLKLANGEDFKSIKEDPKVVFIREQDNSPTLVSKEKVYENR
jgi:carbamoyl-phosphate synthase large subunit